MTTQPRNFNCIDSNGGPFIVIGADHLLAWEGTDDPSDGRAVEATFRWQGAGSNATDYDRAADVPEPIGVISIGEGAVVGDGLVLSDEPLNAGVWQADDSSLPIIFQCAYAEDDAAFESAFSALTPKIVAELPWQDMRVDFRVSSSPLYLFDYAYGGENVFDGTLDDNFLAFDLPVDNYRIARCEFDYTSETRLNLYRFVPPSEV